MKENWLWKLRGKAWRDKALPGDALKVLLNFSDVAIKDLTGSHPLPASTVLKWLGFQPSSLRTAGEIKKLLTASRYLIRDGEFAKGSPPTDYFFLNSAISNIGQPAHVKQGQPAHVKQGQPAHVKQGQPAHVKQGQPASNHISSSFQEECNPNGSNSRAGEFNSSLRSQKRVGNEKAASPQMTMEQAAKLFKKAKQESQLEKLLAEPVSAASPSQLAKVLKSKAAFKK